MDTISDCRNLPPGFPRECASTECAITIACSVALAAFARASLIKSSTQQRQRWIQIADVKENYNKAN